MIKLTMDPITHALSGAVIHQLGFKRKAAFFVLVFSAIAPDLDYIIRLWGVDVFLRYHRGITHGILALFVFPAIVGFIFRKKGGFFYYYFLSFIGYGSHLLLDLTNQYGTRILSPLDWNQYSLDLTFIIDPYISVGLLLTLIAGRLNKKKSSLIAFLCLILIMGYIGLRVYLKNEVMSFLKTKIDANIYRVYPLPNDFLRWSFLTKSSDVVHIGTADLLTKRICVYEEFNLNNQDPAIDLSKKSRVVQNFLYFARFPYSEVKYDGDKRIVIWKELAYSFMAGDRFSAKIVIDKDGRIIKSSFKF